MLREADRALIGQDVVEVLRTPSTALFLLQRFQQFHNLEEERKLLVEGQKAVNLPREQKIVYSDRIRDLEGEMVGLQIMAQALRAGYEPYQLPKNYYVAEFDRKIGGIPDFFMNNWNRRLVEAGLIAGPPIAGVLFAGSEGLLYGVRFTALNLLVVVMMEAYPDMMLRMKYDNLGLEFKAPIPPPVLAKYRQARDTRLFERFVVASPDFELFKETASLFSEPILVGYTRENANRQVLFQPPRGLGGQTEERPGAVVTNGIGFLIASWDLAKDRAAAGR